ncbi:thioredoxin reductase [Microbacterium mangrovi]|uniref:Thioredoxin reductase n=1 Tax=Microbacterium mangrovi TaxID=1348253 RepID=A0A0B2A6P6_9MICO|nr:NAD(P)/FAD-dependent oxidoreductase [Microbacterium mangrovi]KHK97433.1 thioredoxin reductase [Microbacterium mangrovi]
MTPEQFDVAIIGGGAAGLSAALTLGRSRRSVVVIDAGMPRNAPASHMHGFLSRDGFPPAEMLQLARKEVAGYGVRLLPHAATTVRGDVESGFAIRTGDSIEVTARRIILATGVEDRLPAIPGVREAWGRFLLHCPYCHGYEVRDRPLAVFGGLPGAIQYALLIREWTSDLTYLTNGVTPSDDESRTLRARGISVRDGRITALLTDGDRFAGVRLDDGRTVAADAVFMRPTSRPRTEFVASLGGALSPEGFAHVDPSGRTTIPGVWVTGNLVDPRAQVITAAGHANAVAMDVNSALVGDDTQTALLTLD